MKPIIHLVRAADREVQTQLYQDGLQAMWEDRWSLLGPEDREAWVRCHGEAPPLTNPAQERTLILRGVRGLTPHTVKGRMRRIW